MMLLRICNPRWLLVFACVLTSCTNNESTAQALPSRTSPNRPNPIDSIPQGSCAVKPWQVPESINLNFKPLCFGADFSGEGTLLLVSKLSRTQESIQAFFVDATNKRWPLKLSDYSNLQNGQKIKITATDCGGTLVASDWKKIGLNALTTLPVGQQNVAAIRVNYSDALVKVSADTLRTLFSNFLNGYYKENSYGKAWLNPTVLGTVSIAMPSTSCNDIFGIGEAVQAEARRQGLPIDSYERLVYFLPQSKTCENWAGNGEIGRTGRLHSQAWINGYDEEYYERIVAHEMGHNFGLWHARAMDCGKSILSNNCIFKEYGDVSDTMGTGHLTHFNVFEKEHLGWLEEREVQTISASGEYELLPLSSSSSGIKSIKIHAPQISKTPVYYYLEYRQAIGFDRNLEKTGGNFFNGITMHVAADNGASLLLNATAPAQLGFAFSALDTKSMFSDWWNGIDISVSSLTPERARISISLRSPEDAPPKQCQ